MDLRSRSAARENRSPLIGGGVSGAGREKESHRV